VAVSAVVAWLRDRGDLATVRFVLLDAQNVTAYLEHLGRMEAR
jgi:hypothetical protein